MSTAVIGRRSRLAGVGVAGPAPVFPSAIERRYLAYLRKRIRVVSKVTRKVALDVLAGTAVDVEAEVERAIRTDASPEALAAIDLVRQLFADRLPPDEGFVAGLASQTDDAAKAYVARLTAGVLPLDLPINTSAWVATNVDLIKSIDSQYFDDIALIIEEAQAGGWDAGRAGAEISKLTNTPLNRAKLIARDQIATVNSQVTKERQTEVGIGRYRWSTSQDERVRPEHAALEGRIFEWSNPPAIGNPGEPINCRCVAIPVFD